MSKSWKDYYTEITGQEAPSVSAHPKQNIERPAPSAVTPAAAQKPVYNPLDDIMRMYEPKTPTVQTKQYVTGNAALDAWRGSVNTLANERKEKEAKAKAEAEQKEYKQLQSQLDRIDANRAYVTTTEQSDALEKERASVVQRMREIDGTKAKPTVGEKVINAFKGSGSRTTERFTPEQEEQYTNLLLRLDSVNASAVFAITTEQSDAIEKERKETLSALHQLDADAGRAARAYDARDRADAFFKSWGKGTAASYTNTAGSMLDLADAAHQASGEAQRRVADNPYAGYATDPLTEANFAAAPTSEETSGFLASQRKERDALYETADKLLTESEKQMAKAKYGTSAVGSFALDAAKTGMDILADTAASAVGVPGLANMAARVYGGESQQARLAGDDVYTAAAKGLKSALIEVATEKVAGPFEKAYGKTALSSSINKAVDKLNASGLLKWAADAAGEGFEEGMSDVLNTVADHIAGWDDGTSTVWNDIKGDKEQILYDILLGAFVGAFGGAGNLANTNARSNAAPVQQSTPAAAQSAEAIQQPQTRANVQEGNLAPTTPANVKQGGSDELNSALNLNSRDTTARTTKERREALDQRLARFMERVETEGGDPAAQDALTAEAEAIDAEDRAIKAAEEQTRRVDAGEVSKAFGNPENHIDNRSFADVASKNTKAFQFDHPELHGYFVDAAQSLLSDVQAARDADYLQRYKRGGADYHGPINRLVDSGMTKPRIMQCLNDIISNNGAENYADAKRVEIVLNDMLSGGWLDMSRNSHPANNEYIAAKERIEGAADRDSWTKYREDHELSIADGSVTEEQLRHEWEARRSAEVRKNTAPTQETSNTTQEIRATENNNAAFSNANVQGEYSVERNDAGSVTIRINNSILAGQPQKAWAGIVKQKIQEIFSGGLDLPRGTIFSNKKGRGEFTNGSYTKMLERTQPELYRAKMGMTPGTGAMVENASDVRFESPAHERADDIVGFNRGNIRVIVEGEGYTGDVLTAVYSDGKEVFFDVNNIAKEKGEAPSERYAARNSGFSQADGASTSEDFSSDTSIPTTGRNVNSENGGNAVRERGFSKNVRTDNAMEPKIRESFDTAPETYKQLANKDTLAKAEDIFAKGLDEARGEVEQALGAAKSGSKLAPEMVPLARMVANELSKNGNVESARRILADVATELTAAGQLGQAGRILRDSDPSTALASIQKSLDAINAEFAKQHKRSNWKAELTKAETEKILSTDFTEDGAYARVYDEIATRLGKEMPSSVLEKLTEIRRINMLLRPRTQIKNVASNVPMIGLRKGAETLSIGIQSALTKTGLMDEAERTRAWASKEQRQLAKDYYEANKADINGQSNKWDFKSALREKRTIFKGGAIEKAVSKMTGKEIDSFGEALRQVTYSCLEAGDAPFVKSAFVDSLAQYCAAKGITDSKNITQEAIDFATVNAMEATFKNANFIADVVNQVKRNSSPALSAAVDILIPFTTTPANILSLMGDYSPIGFGKMFAKDGVAAKIDAFSKASVGTAVMALGLALRSAGIITGGEDDDKDKAALDKATGQGTYSIGGKVSYDWAQPAGSLLAFGAEIADAIKGQESWLSAFMNAIYTAGDATLNLSLFQNVVSVLRGSGKPTQQIVDAIMEGGATQLVPGLAGDIAKIIDGTVRSTYTGGNVFADIGAKVLSNTPILSQKLPESVNVKGEANTRGGFAERAVNILLNPTNTTSGKRNAVDEEIYRLYDATGSTVFFPSVSPYKIEYANQTYTMDGKDRETFQKVQGRTYYELAQPLLSSEMYKALSDDQKASVLKSIRDYALDAAKRQFVDGRGGEYSNDQWDPVAELTKGQISAYIPAKQALKDGANGNGGRKTFEAIDLLLDGYKKLPGAVQDKLNGEKLNVANLLYADSKGIGSKAWYDTHNAIDGTSAVAAASSVSRNFKGSDEEKLDALRTMNSYTMPDKETGKQSAIVRRYEAAMNYGVSFDDWTRLEETIVDMFGSGTPNKSEIYAAAKEALPNVPQYKVYNLYKKDSANEKKVDIYDMYFADLYEPTGGKPESESDDVMYKTLLDMAGLSTGKK